MKEPWVGDSRCIIIKKNKIVAMFCVIYGYNILILYPSGVQIPKGWFSIL